MTTSALSVSPGGLNETFASDTTAYTVSVAHDAAQVTATWTLGDAGATVETLDSSDGTLNDADGTTEGFQVDLGAAGSATVFKVKVTAADGDTSLTYTVTVNRASASTDSTLSALEVQDTSVPSFAPDTHDYTVQVGSSATQVTVKATVNDPRASVDPAAAATAAGHTVTLDASTKVITVTVTAEDTSTTTNTVTVTTVAPQAGATVLSGLTVGGVDQTLNLGPDNPIEVPVGYMAGRGGVLVEATAGEGLLIVSYAKGNFLRADQTVDGKGLSKLVRVEPGESVEVHIVVWQGCCPFGLLDDMGELEERDDHVRSDRCDEYTKDHCYKLIITRAERPLSHDSVADAPHPVGLRWVVWRHVPGEDDDDPGRWTKAHPDYWADMQSAEKLRVELSWDDPDVAVGETILGYWILRSRYPMDQHYPPHDTPARDNLIEDATVIQRLFTTPTPTRTRRRSTPIPTSSGRRARGATCMQCRR